MIGFTKLAAGEGNVDLAERPERPVGAGEVALDVRAAGVCGTDLHIWFGEYAGEPPVTMGHEVCGTVAEIGEGVDPAWAGVETFFGSGAGIADGLRAMQMGLRGADVTIPYDLICFKELTVTAGFPSNPHSWRRAFEASRAGDGVTYVLNPR